MKKIYMILAAMALLTLSLNAQEGKKVVEPSKFTTETHSMAQGKAYTGKTAKAKSMSELLAGIKGMSSILPEINPNGTSSSGSMRAPKRLNSGEYLVGPYTTDDFSTNGLGFPTAYNTYQQIYMFTDLVRSDFVDHDGDEIVGFRFALAGSSSDKAVLYDFHAWPYGTNGYFETANRHTWSIPDLAGAAPVTSYDDIVITVPSYYSMFTSITVYGDNNTVLTSWNSNSTDVGTTSSNNTYYNLPDGWDAGNYYFLRYSNGTNYFGYLSTDGQATLTISSEYLSGQSSVRVEISAMGYQSGMTVNVNGETWNLSTSIGTHTFNLSPSGSSAPTYIELTGGQWHEFYLDAPVPFSVADSIVGMYLGYRYFQYPSTETSEFLYPIAVNPNSTSHNHYSYRYGATSSGYSDIVITPYSNAVNFYSIAVVSGNTTITSWTTSNGNSLPSGWSCSSTWNYSSRYGGYTSGTITIPASLFSSYDNVKLVVNAYGDNANQSITVGDVQKPITQSAADYTWDISKTTIYQSGWWTEDFSNYGDLAVQLIFQSSIHPTIEISPATQTISDAAAGSLTVTGTDITGNINVSADNNWSLNPTSLSNTGGNVNVTYTGRELSATTTVTATAANDNNVSASATVNYVADVYIVGNFGSGWNFNNGTQMTYNNGTYTATITVNAGNYILFARMLGNNNPWNTREVFGPDSSGDWWVTSDNATGTIDVYDDDPIYFPNGGTYRVTINSDGTLIITKLNGEQTAPPVITYTVSADGEYVTITATGDGTVTLNVPGYDPVIGENGVASITIPCGVASNTITVTATAKETGKDESVPTSQPITIPAGSGWTQMTGTYDNIADLLTFQTIVGNDTTDIMLIDQFLESTLLNEQPDHYTYTLRQTVNGETQTSTPITIPVYKTDSKMMGLYTLNQVMGDTDMGLKANVFNTEMDFDANPDHNVLYYSLYRGKKNATYPLIADSLRVSQLQKFQENVGNDNVQFFFFESHQEGVIPRYLQADHIGHQVVERLDTNWVEGVYDDMLPYVPVIWTYGLYTARGDGKNNSYGSDIKREYMGSVQATITGEYTNVNDANGTFDVNGVDYIIYHPVIKVTGNLPQNNNNNEVDYNDGDKANYEPFMCRAWCTYKGIRDFGRDADGHLVGRDTLPTPYLLGTEMMNTPLDTIGGLWTGGSERDAWSFGLPATVDPASVTFIIRFYYKKVVSEAQQNGGNGAKLGNEEEEYFIAQTEGDADEMIVGINEFMSGVVPVSVTYVNPQGMQSNRPFSGVNIVVTRYSDGTTRTYKIIR